MSSGFRETLQAIWVSKKFTKFFSGVQFSFPEYGDVEFKVVSSSPATRTPGYRFKKYSIMTGIESSRGLLASGYGESDIEIIALQKSIAEAVERNVFKIAKQLNPSLLSTNGWAAHLSQKSARHSAQSELLERDTSLLHWLSKTPFFEIEPATWPRNLRTWVLSELSKASRFNRLRLLISQLGSVPVIVAIIHDSNGYGFASQAHSQNLETAIDKSLSEVCRIADFSQQGYINPPDRNDPESPEGHAVYYSSQEPFPEWLYGSSISLRAAQKKWKEQLATSNPPESTFFDFTCGPLHIAQCRSKETQDLFFGKTELAAARGWINFNRLEKFCGTKVLYPLPHFVP